MLNLETGAGSSTLASKFNAGEERRESGGDLAYIALAAAAPGATSVKVQFFFHIILKGRFKILVINHIIFGI